MRNYFLLCGAATAALFLLNTIGAMAQTGAVPPPAVQTIPPSAWGKMTEIKSVEVPTTDVSELLGLHMWQFDVVGTKPAHAVRCILEVQETGKPPHTLEETGIDPQKGWPQDGRLSVFIGLYPLYDGQGVSTKTKYEVRINSFHTAPQVEQGGSAVFSVLDNPLTALSIMNLSAPDRRPDGSFVLSYAQKAIRPLKLPGDIALVFRVEEEAN